MPPSSPPPSLGPPRTVARRIAFGFVSITVVVVVLCAAVAVVVGSITHSIEAMRDDEVVVRESLELAMAVREQYIHQAHVIIGDRSHLGHYGEWVDKVAKDADGLRARFGPNERSRIDRVASDSTELDALFRNEILPAIDRGDQARVQELHQRAEQLSGSAVSGADGLARLTEERMNHHHAVAIATAYAGLGIGGGCLLLVIALAALHTVRLRRSVLHPLAALANAAERIGGGDFGVGAGNIGDGEFRAVGRAYDRMAHELRARETRLLQAERMAVLGQLAAGVAHEINNPIGVIRGYLRTMKPKDSPDEIAEGLRIVDEEAAACQRIAEDLLAYSRAGQLSPSALPVDELLKETARRFAESGEAAEHHVEVGAESATIVADPGRVRQVLLNLLRNAVQSSPDGAAVELNGAARAEGYEISVADRGSGVSEEDSQRIFEPFFSKRGSSGLGLSVCDGIVAAHGGTIRVESRDGGGAVFRVMLPFEAATSDEGRADA